MSQGFIRQQRGQTGIAGATGPSITGETGPTGATGNAGIQGETGISIQGETGPIGFTGILGDTGVGIQGETGISIQGETGIGAQGETGVIGVAGTQGVTGIQGVTGSGIGPYDLPETGFSLSNNQSTAADVTGFVFNSAVRSFNATVSVGISATASLFEVFNIIGVQQDAGWSLGTTSAGDDSGVDFTITSGGQIQYTSSNVSEFGSGVIRFRASATSDGI